MSCSPTIFVHQQFHQFPFAGELVLFAHDFQEGDGVVEVEFTEVEALGGGFGRDAELVEEAVAGAAFDGGVQLFPEFAEDGVLVEKNPRENDKPDSVARAHARADVHSSGPALTNGFKLPTRKP